MKNFKSFVTKRSLVEEKKESKTKSFIEILTHALTQGRLTTKSHTLYLLKKGPSTEYSAYAALLEGLEDNGIITQDNEKALEFLDTIFIPYFLSVFKGKTTISKINEKWEEIYNDAIGLYKSDPTGGYIVPDPDFSTAATKLLKAKDVESPEVKFFIAQELV